MTDSTKAMGVTRGISYSIFTLLFLLACCARSAQNQEHRVRNIVLVHGAWADGSGWKGVYDILLKDGYKPSDMPIACRLSDAELREREATLLAQIKSAVIATEELQDGYIFHVRGDKKTYAAGLGVYCGRTPMLPLPDIRVDCPTEYGTNEHSRDWPSWCQAISEDHPVQFRGVSEHSG